MVRRSAVLSVAHSAGSQEVYLLDCTDAVHALVFSHRLHALAVRAFVTGSAVVEDAVWHRRQFTAL